MLELHYRGQKVIAVQVWAGAVPDIGTLMLGETDEQARATLARLEEIAEHNDLTSIEIELRLIMVHSGNKRDAHYGMKR